MKNLYTKIAFATLLAVPAVTFAASPFLKPVKDVLGDLEIFINFLNWALPALGVLIFFGLVIMFILNKMQITKFGAVSNSGLFAGIVGLAVMFAVYGLIQLIGALFGIDTNRAKTITAPSLPQVGGVRGGGYYNN
jgi:ABC-type arginine transport system permease subunit